MATTDVSIRLEYLRGELRAARISYEELCELQSLAPYIDASDVELLEAAGVPESEPSVRSEWEMECPECHKDDRICIDATISVRLVPDGTEIEPGDHVWSNDSTCFCGHCGHCGTVKDFEIDR